MDGLHTPDQLTAIAVVALAALLCGMALARMRQPAVVGYIFAGVLLGPSGFGAVENRETIQLLAELGVLMLLFLIGMELSLRAFRAVWKIALFTTLTQIALGVASMLLLARLFNWSLPLGLLLGFVVALSSTAVCIKMLEEAGELKSRVGEVTLGVLIAQDLAVVPMMLILGAVATAEQVAAIEGGGEAGGGFPLAPLLKIALSVGFLVLLIVYLSRRQRVHLPFARVVGQNIDLTPLAGLAFCFGAATLSGLLGLSAAYGAFLAGLVIGNSTARRTMIRHTAPIQSVLLMVFFLSIGLLLDLGFIWDNLGIVLLLLFFIIVLKTVVNVLAIRLFGEIWPRAFLAGVTLAQIGEFSFVLAALGLSLGITDAYQQRLIVALTVVSLIIAPLYLTLARRLHRVTREGVTSGSEALRITFDPAIRAARKAREQGLRLAERAAGALPERPLRLPRPVASLLDRALPVRGPVRGGRRKESRKS